MLLLKPVPTSHAIIYHNKRLLLLLRDDKPSLPNPNKWSLIGGVIESGETYKQAMRREMKEEINILPKSIKYLGKLKTPDGNPHFIFLIKMTKSEVNKMKLGNEGQEIKFFNISEIEKLQLAKDLKIYFKRQRGCLEDWLDGNSPLEPKKIGLS